MAIGTFSRFFYGYEITLQANKINFDEGGPELTVTIPLGVYSPTQLAEELETQLTAIGSQIYTVVFNRSSRSFTISAPGTFSLLITSGTQVGVTAYGVFGFSGPDLSGSTSYEGSTSGSEYITQFPPQDYVPAGQEIIKSDASVNTSADGTVEVVSFGNVSFISMNLLFITNLLMDNKVIRYNPNGVQDALDFLTFAIKRGAIEFMPDKDDVGTFETVILESTAASRTGIGFKLQEETGKNLPGIYRTGNLQFRVL